MPYIHLKECQCFSKQLNTHQFLFEYEKERKDNSASRSPPALVPVLPHLWSSGSEQFWNGLLPALAVHNVAVRDYFHCSLQMEDECRIGHGDVFSLLRLHRLQPSLRVWCGGLRPITWKMK
ncbi:hypothetical protein CEXT_797861 [Caerostris extrusa]|uniref:Uncharacterized protein n=1 Tax=Caerostris extrusa TaxID=172846 RepID=A0AAV4SPF6_CAEEX|nr:hypothetical protein CEXT_797861 [Caerostris extrusa]